jgi:hypothetical protein
VVNKKKLLITLVALCAMALFVGTTTMVSADTDTSTTTTTGDDTTTTTEGATTTTAPETTTTTEDVNWWTVQPISFTDLNLVPSYVSVGDKKVVWTGITPGGFSGMYVYDIVAQTNTPIPQILPGNYYNPDCDGSLVVYQGGRAGGYDDIFVYDTNNGVIRQLTQNSDPGDYNDWNPRIDNDRIVWEKDMLGASAKPGIYLFDMNTVTISCVLAGDEYHTPDVAGDYIVAVKSEGSSTATEIVLYNIKTQVTEVISPPGTNNEHPRIDRGQVVWASGDAPSTLYYPWSTYQIYLYDIASGESTALTDNAAGNFNPTICNGIVAWEQFEPAGLGIIDLPGNRQGLFSQGVEVKGPEADDDYVVYFAGSEIYYSYPEANGALFIDVGDKDAYAEAINAMADMGIIEGYETGYFGIDDLVTRQQYAKMILLTMAEWNPTIYTPSLHDTCTFADSASIEKIAGELYPYHYIAKASRTGLTFGFPDGTFRPLANITRQQVISMIVRAAGTNLQTPPADWQGVLSYVDPEHGERIRIAEYNGLLDGIVGGSSGGLYGWDTRYYATRGEVAQMLYNLLGLLGVPIG